LPPELLLGTSLVRIEDERREKRARWPLAATLAAPSPQSVSNEHLLFSRNADRKLFRTFKTTSLAHTDGILARHKIKKLLTK
jgi:hypothetical protein